MNELPTQHAYHAERRGVAHDHGLARVLEISRFVPTWRRRSRGDLAEPFVAGEQRPGARSGQRQRLGLKLDHDAMGERSGSIEYEFAMVVGDVTARQLLNADSRRPVGRSTVGTMASMARQVRADTAADESSLLGLVAEWALTPAQFGYPWDTDDPQ
jgi:hypothetical protein